jgi:hypothetical protein
MTPEQQALVWSTAGAAIGSLAALAAALIGGVSLGHAD